MAPLVILVVVTLVLAGAGAAGVPWLRPWQMALRGGVAAMFTATGVAHFVGLREQMISMVPPALPAPGLLVTLTGILELAGAAGVLWPRTTKWAAAGLSAMLVLMFPANVHAAVDHVLTAWHDQLVPRTLMQVVFLAATLTVSGHARRSRPAEPVRPLAQ